VNERGEEELSNEPLLIKNGEGDSENDDQQHKIVRAFLIRHYHQARVAQAKKGVTTMAARFLSQPWY
jgi:hypothetical protein